MFLHDFSRKSMTWRSWGLRWAGLEWPAAQICFIWFPSWTLFHETSNASYACWLRAPSLRLGSTSLFSKTAENSGWVCITVVHTANVTSSESFVLSLDLSFRPKVITLLAYQPIGEAGTKVRDFCARLVASVITALIKITRSFSVN